MPQSIMMWIVDFRTKLINIFYDGMYNFTSFKKSKRNGWNSVLFTIKNRVGGDLCFIREDFQLINFEFLQC